jgi:GTPase
MVLLETSLKPVVVRDFEAEIKILNKTTCNLAKGYESVIHCGVIR